MKKITYVLKKGKYIFNKEGIYFSLTNEQIENMKYLFNEIDQNKDKK